MKTQTDVRRLGLRQQNFEGRFIKKVVKPCERKSVATYAVETHGISITRSCRTVQISKTMYYYQSIRDDSAVIDKLKELSEKKPMEGQDKYYARIRNEGII